MKWKILSAAGLTFKMLLIIFTLIAHFLGSSECSQELTLKSTLSEQSLDLNCTLRNAHADNISLVMSVVISKSSANQDEILASAASVGGASPVTHHLEDAVVTSDLTWDGNSDSFLSIHWSRASQALVGNYTCTLNGLNNDYVPVTLVSMVTVSLDDTVPSLIATPLVIEIGLTESLSLNCSLLGPNLLNLTSVSLIQLSYVHDGIDQILASVRPTTGPESELGSGASHVTGFLGDQTKGSYLEATWQFPDVDNTGEYVCQVVGINSSSLPVLYRTAVNVTAKDLSREDLVNKIVMLQSENIKLQEDKQSLEERLVLKSQQLQDFNTSSMQHISAMEDQYQSALHNLTLLGEQCQNATASANEIIEHTPANKGFITYNFSCTFDTDLCGFTDDREGSLYWERISGIPPGVNTGLSGDHTSGAGYYMNLHSSAGHTPGVARLTRDFPAFAADGCTIVQQGSLIYWYHKDVYGVGGLNVYIGEDEKDSLFFTGRQVRQGSSWWRADILLTTVDQPFSVTFEATRSHNYQGQIAIDDITILATTFC